MPSSDLLSRLISERLTAQQPDQAAESVASLWAPLAIQIISIIGAAGFQSLFARSVFLCQSTFPWLSANSPSAQTDGWLVDLQTSLQGQPPVLTSEANCLLLRTFTNLLASLIGEPLTARILNSAWNVSTRDTVGKEQEND